MRFLIYLVLALLAAISVKFIMVQHIMPACDRLLSMEGVAIGLAYIVVLIFAALIIGRLCRSPSTESELTEKNEKKELSLLTDEVIDDIDKEKVLPLKNQLEALKNEKTFFSVGLIGPWGSGKSSFIKTLQKKLDASADFETVYINLWELERPEIILETLRGRIISRFSCMERVKYYFSPDSHYFRLLIQRYKPKNIVESLLQIMLESDADKAKKSFQEAIPKGLGGKKLVIFFDELDRLSRADEILEALKIIRSLTDFENTVAITAFDDRQMNQVLEKVRDVNFSHKIFNLNYPQPVITQKDFSTLFKDENRFGNQMCWHTFLFNYSFLGTKLSSDKVVGQKNPIEVIENVRQLKIAINQTNTLIHILKQQDQEWEEKIAFECIAILSMIKALDLSFFQSVKGDDSVLWSYGKEDDEEQKKKHNDFITDQKKRFHPNAVDLYADYYNKYPGDKEIYLRAAFKPYDMPRAFYEGIDAETEPEKAKRRIIEEYNNMHGSEYKKKFLKKFYDSVSHKERLYEALIECDDQDLLKKWVEGICQFSDKKVELDRMGEVFLTDERMGGYFLATVLEELKSRDELSKYDYDSWFDRYKKTITQKISDSNHPLLSWFEKNAKEIKQKKLCTIVEQAREIFDEGLYQGIAAICVEDDTQR